MPWGFNFGYQNRNNNNNNYRQGYQPFNNYQNRMQNNINRYQNRNIQKMQPQFNPQQLINNQPQNIMQSPNMISPGSPVTYEPIDEKKLAEIQAELNNTNKMPQNNSNISDNKETIVFTRDNNKFILDKLSYLSQYERNSSLFYNYLSDICNKEGYKRILLELSTDSKNQSKYCRELYKQISGKEFEIQDTVVNNNISFDRGIYWAIEEESKALNNISDILDQIFDNENRNKINKIFYKKVSRLSFLHLINGNNN